VPPLAQEHGGQPAHAPPAEGLLPPEAAPPGIEHVGTVPVIEPAGLVAVGDDEELWRDERAPVGAFVRVRTVEVRLCAVATLRAHVTPASMRKRTGRVRFGRHP
jgi:hypothetical protein